MSDTQVQKPEEFKGFLQSLIDSKKLPSHVKTVEDAFAIAQMGKELGFATMQAFHYIIPVQGRLTLSAKAIGALLRKGGIEYITKEDGVFIYKDGSTEPSIEGEKPVDQRTSMIFYRNGREEECNYTWNDGTKQGLTSKENWRRLPKEMLYCRCLSKGANRIGPDLLLGLYVTEEMTDALNVPENKIKREEDGTISVIEILETK